MRLQFLLLFVVIMSSALVSAASFNFTKTTINDVIVKELNNPATYELAITNYGVRDDFSFYNYAGFRMYPVGTVSVESGETKKVLLSFYPSPGFENKGNYLIEYFVNGAKGGQTRDDADMRVIPLSDLFEVGSENLKGDSGSITFYLQNNEAIDLEKVKVSFSSAFFNKYEEFSLSGKEKKQFVVQLNKEDYKKLIAGLYTLKADIDVNGQKTTEEAVIKFVENEKVSTTTRNYGVLINHLVIRKSNDGNVVSKADVVIDKNIVTRLFTSFSPQPDGVERNGFVVHYLWSRDLQPGDELEVTVKTNWLFPLLLIIIIICVVWLTRALSKTHVVVRKKVHFVRVKGKGGEFALKVSIVVQAKNFVERVNVVDRVPGMMKIFDQFGSERPVSVDEKTGRIVWKFENLDKGEIRVLSYIVYSKLGVLGKFVLPAANVLFERNGSVMEVQSNKAFFVADQADTEDNL